MKHFGPSLRSRINRHKCKRRRVEDIRRNNAWSVQGILGISNPQWFLLDIGNPARIGKFGWFSRAEPTYHCRKTPRAWLDRRIAASPRAIR
jgi:hypothetical protein